MSGGTFPAFVSAGDILTDMVRAGDAQWTSVPGGAGWNVARARLRARRAERARGSIGEDCFSDVLWRTSEAADRASCSASHGRCSRSSTRRARPYFFIGGRRLAFDPARLPAAGPTT